MGTALSFGFELLLYVGCVAKRGECNRWVRSGYQHTGDKCPPELVEAGWTASAMMLERMNRQALYISIWIYTWLMYRKHHGKSHVW